MTSTLETPPESVASPEKELTEEKAVEIEKVAVKAAADSHGADEIKKPWYVRYPTGVLHFSLTTLTLGVFSAKKLFDLLEWSAKAAESGKLDIKAGGGSHGGGGAHGGGGGHGGGH